MTDESVRRIEILKEIPFDGEGDTLVNRLRKITLRGFPDIKIYENAKFEMVKYGPKDILSKLHTPQLRVYRDHLNRIGVLAALFLREGIDITNLDRGYDFIATSESGKETEWTMMPPIIERFSIPKTEDGRFDYENNEISADILKEALRKEGLWFNPDALAHRHTTSGIYDLINDGSHRVHYGYEKGGITVLRISNITPGFPYYAIPQKYNIRVFSTREEALNIPETKIHVVQEPAHKNLYRLFPSGGIKSGDVRLTKSK